MWVNVDWNALRETLYIAVGKYSSSLGKQFDIHTLKHLL